VNTQQERPTDTALESLVDIDYTGFHGPVGTALVTEPGTPFEWFESVTLIGYYCEDEEHTGEECQCVTEAELCRATYENLTGRGLTPVTGY